MKTPPIPHWFLTGLQTSEDARFYALSTKFKPFSNEGKNLVVQFSVKHEQDIDCGGGYLKVFDCNLDSKDMHGETPYEIMFGPDICGPGTKKVRLFFFSHNIVCISCIESCYFFYFAISRYHRRNLKF